MEIFKIKSKSTGNCSCVQCGKYQEGMKLQPFTVWHKAENEKRGHNEPMCSLECCKKYIKNFNK